MTTPKIQKLLVELPLEDKKNSFPCRNRTRKFGNFMTRLKKGMYHEFHLVKNNVLFRSIVDNGHKFEARAIFRTHWVDVVLHLGNNQSGHNGYQRTYAAIKCLYYWKGMRVQILQYCKSCKVCAIQMVKKTQFEKANL